MSQSSSQSSEVSESPSEVYLPPRFSKTSDHKPVFMEFFLKDIQEPLIALTYNMSFASDLGIATGSEAYFVAQNKSSDRRAYWKNAANLVDYFVNLRNPTIMYFQEMNDRDMIERNPPFNGGYQALLELLASGKVSYINERKSCLPRGSYYTTGTYIGKNGQNYGFVAYSIEVIKGGNSLYPTVLTIWNTDVLGEFDGFYGNDLGLHSNYSSNPTNLGRNFSCVKTSNPGVVLINLHGPNEPALTNTSLKPAIGDYMEAAREVFVFTPELAVIGGDTNDSGLYNDNPDYIKSGDPDRRINPETIDRMRELEYEKVIYKYEGRAPLSCCAEFSYDVLINQYGNFKPYKYYGDKIYVHYAYLTPDELDEQKKQNPNIYKNQLVIETVPVDPTLAYGIRSRFRNLKKRKTIKKKRHNKKNKKSFKKRRIFRRKTRKTRKHKHKQ